MKGGNKKSKEAGTPKKPGCPKIKAKMCMEGKINDLSMMRNSKNNQN